MSGIKKLIERFLNVIFSKIKFSNYLKHHNRFET